MIRRRLFSAGMVVLFLAAVFAGGFWFGASSERLKEFDARKQLSPHAAPASHEVEGIEVVAGSHGHLRLSNRVLQSLSIHVAPVRIAPETEPLVLAGSLFLDSSRLAVVHARFSGEIIKVGEVSEADPNGNVNTRQLRVGDSVKKHDVLAVIWSKEIGEKKSDLVEAVSRRSASKSRLDRLSALENGSVSIQMVRDARRQYESDVIAVERAERTLRSWKESEAEIAEVYAEADRISRGESPNDSSIQTTWANVEVRAPLDGIVLEHNVSIGEIVDTGFDMFKIANLNRMGVLANVYEEDIPRLASLPVDHRRWVVRLKAEPEAAPIAGAFEVIGHVIDPGQHTAAVMGWIENPGRRFRTGQFVTATIDMPGLPDAVLVPNSAVIDEGTQATVFVATDVTGREVTARHVCVLRRGRDFALIQRTPDNKLHSLTAEPLHEGELVVTSGNLELFGVIQNQPLTATAP
jgi:membrane fusion protein, heavy metal efflux system